MEKLLENTGVAGILAAISVMLALNFLAKLGEFLWKFREKKDALTESGIEKLTNAVHLNTMTTEKLEVRLNHLEHALLDVKKFERDLRRVYTALKKISGEQWPEIRKEIMEDDE